MASQKIWKMFENINWHGWVVWYMCRIPNTALYTRGMPITVAQSSTGNFERKTWSMPSKNLPPFLCVKRSTIHLNLIERIFSYAKTQAEIFKPFSTNAVQRHHVLWLNVREGLRNPSWQNVPATTSPVMLHNVILTAFTHATVASIKGFALDFSFCTSMKVGWHVSNSHALPCHILKFDIVFCCWKS